VVAAHGQAVPSVLVYSRRRFLRGVPSQFTESHLPLTKRPFTESVPHLRDLTSSFAESVKDYKNKGCHRELTLREAACLQSPAELIQVPCRCQGNCMTVRCKSFKATAECTVHCHGRNGGAQCINTGPSIVPSGIINLERNTRSAPP